VSYEGVEEGGKELLERKAREAQEKNPMQDTELSLWARKLQAHLKEHRQGIHEAESSGEPERRRAGSDRRWNSSGTNCTRRQNPNA
jgi:hypothetical protein